VVQERFKIQADNEVGRKYIRETAWSEKVAGGENNPRGEVWNTHKKENRGRDLTRVRLPWKLKANLYLPFVLATLSWRRLNQRHFYFFLYLRLWPLVALQLVRLLREAESTFKRACPKLLTRQCLRPPNLPLIDSKSRDRINDTPCRTTKSKVGRKKTGLDSYCYIVKVG
jgi:hypothetical protein